MNVLMFVSNPFTNDPRVYAEAKSLVQAGYKVTVVAWDRERENPLRQTWDGIDIIRLRTRLLPKRHSVGQPLWVGFNLLLWQRQAYRQALALNRENALDVVHCHNFDTLAIGSRLKRKLDLPLVYDAHEIYGYMVARTLPRWIANIFLRLEGRGIRQVDRMITDGDGRRRYFSGITGRPITVIMNCKPLQGVEYEPPDNEDLNLLYIGSLHQGRLVLMLVRAAKDLSGVRCLIGGIGPPAYVRAVKEASSATSNATFLGRVPIEEVIPMTKEAHAIVCVINPDDVNNRLGMANKIGEAMVCGRPIICTRGTHSGELTEQEGAGFVVDHSERALREAIIRLRDTPELREKLGRNALKAAITKYNWQKEEEKLLALYESLQI